jgi:hypothetical protein
VRVVLLSTDTGTGRALLDETFVILPSTEGLGWSDWFEALYVGYGARARRVTFIDTGVDDATSFPVVPVVFRQTEIGTKCIGGRPCLNLDYYRGAGLALSSTVTPTGAALRDASAAAYPGDGTVKWMLNLPRSFEVKFDFRLATKDSVVAFSVGDDVSTPAVTDDVRTSHG